MVTNCVLIGGPYDKQRKEFTQPPKVIEFPYPLSESAGQWRVPSLPTRDTSTIVRYVWFAREIDTHYYRHEHLPHYEILTYLTK